MVLLQRLADGGSAVMLEGVWPAPPVTSPDPFESPPRVFVPAFLSEVVGSPTLKQAPTGFLSTPPHQCDSACSGCVLQGECGVVLHTPDLVTGSAPPGVQIPAYLGSVNATTCIMVGLHVPSVCVGDGPTATTGPPKRSAVAAGAEGAAFVAEQWRLGGTCVAHLDTNERVEEFFNGILPTFLTAVERLNTALRTAGSPLDSRTPEAGVVQLTLVGAFDDGTECCETSRDLVDAVFQHASAVGTPLALTSHCVLRDNTDTAAAKGHPKVFDMAIDVRTGCAAPAAFSSVGAHAQHRGLRWASEPWPLLPAGFLYPPAFPIPAPLLLQDCYFVDPFLFEVPLKFLREVLTYSDDELLERLSTSPHAEPPHFPAEMRENIRFALEHSGSRWIPSFPAPRYSLRPHPFWVVPPPDTRAEG